MGARRVLMSADKRQARMTVRTMELRKKARHCRELANHSPPGVMQAELAKMADEFHNEADALEKPIGCFRPIEDIDPN